ncbi:MAG: phosphatidate cytidylyltransferase [Methylococcaceae bacterium]|nr:phosphatidate cytidylyltransferase [Methylococcaceae bacterium]
MLIQRIITASILAILISLAVFLLPVEYFSLLIGLVTLLAAWEWSHLIGITVQTKRGLFLLALIIPMLWLHFWTQFLEVGAHFLELSQQAIYQNAKNANWTGLSSYMESFDLPDIRTYSGLLEWLVVPPVLFWILTMILIRNAPAGLLNLELKLRNKALIGWFVLLATWMFLTRLRVFYGPEMTLYFLILIWVADISAYFVGKKYGKIRLAPDISPGKTIEGMYGALLAGVICGIAASLIYGFQYMIAADFALLSVLTVLISIYGDLFFSLAKRLRGVKDSGNLLPGHGGVLDRIDSLIAAVPFFYAGIIIIYRQVS